MSGVYCSNYEGPIAGVHNLTPLLLCNSRLCSVHVDDAMKLAPEEPEPLKGDLNDFELAGWTLGACVCA